MIVSLYVLAFLSVSMVCLVLGVCMCPHTYTEAQTHRGWWAGCMLRWDIASLVCVCENVSAAIPWPQINLKPAGLEKGDLLLTALCHGRRGATLSGTAADDSLMLRRLAARVQQLWRKMVAGGCRVGQGQDDRGPSEGDGEVGLVDRAVCAGSDGNIACGDA